MNSSDFLLYRAVDRNGISHRLETTRIVRWAVAVHPHKTRHSDIRNTTIMGWFSEEENARHLAGERRKAGYEVDLIETERITRKEYDNTVPHVIRIRQRTVNNEHV